MKGATHAGALEAGIVVQLNEFDEATRDDDDDYTPAFPSRVREEVGEFHEVLF